MRERIRNSGNSRPSAEIARPTTKLLLLLLLLANSACSSVAGNGSPSGKVVAAADAADESRLIARGRSQFLHCNSCHVTDANAPPPFGDSLGPHLENIVGRPSGSVEGFDYSAELMALNLVWDETTLDEWLQRPQAEVPGLCEPFMGMANAEHRKALIAYLKNPPR
jgi:cytochrome c